MYINFKYINRFQDKYEILVNNKIIYKVNLEFYNLTRNRDIKEFIKNVIDDLMENNKYYKKILKCM